MTGRPYTPETLAERWSCKPQHVRALLLRRALKGFRVGKLWRIAADEVERYEREGESCAHESNEPPPSEGSTSGSAGTGEGTSSNSVAGAIESAARLVRQIPSRPRLVSMTSRRSSSG